MQEPDAGLELPEDMAQDEEDAGDLEADDSVEPEEGVEQGGKFPEQVGPPEDTAPDAETDGAGDQELPGAEVEDVKMDEEGTGSEADQPHDEHIGEDDTEHTGKASSRLAHFSGLCERKVRSNICNRRAWP